MDYDYFVTCAHFLHLRKRVQEGTLNQNLVRLAQAEPVSAWISRIRYEQRYISPSTSTSILTESCAGDRKRQPARLCTWHAEYDIAIFRYPRPEQNHNKPTVFQSQLMETEKLLRSQLAPNSSSRFKNTVWSTGYNGLVEAG